MTPTPPEQNWVELEAAEPYANKALVAATGTVVLVGLRWAVSGHLNLDDEGLVALAGAITTVAVYTVSNFRRILSVRDDRGFVDLGLVIGLLVVLILLVVLLRLV